MGTKNNPGKFDCYANALPDEPMFVLLGRDERAPALVEAWADESERRGTNPEKIAEARTCAAAMRDWRKRNPVKPRPRYTNASGLFIVIEGPDGVGKSTLVQKLVEHYEAKGLNPLGTRQPSDGDTGRFLRRMLTSEEPRPSPLDMAELYAKDRLEHLGNVILPALARGEIVICDRYVLSSYAYQCGAQGIAQDYVDRLNKYTIAPDLTYVLLASEEVCAERRRARGGKPELFETSEVQRRVDAVYRESYRYLPLDDVYTVDASGSVDETFGRLIENIDAEVRARRAQ